MEIPPTQRVLIVDDDEPMLELYRAALRGLVAREVAIDTCTTGEEATMRLRATSYAMVIADYQMGFMTGIDLLEIALRDSPSTARILMTGHAELSLAQEAIDRAQIQGFVTKPRSYFEIAAELGKALDTHLTVAV